MSCVVVSQRRVSVLSISGQTQTQSQTRNQSQTRPSMDFRKRGLAGMTLSKICSECRLRVRCRVSRHGAERRLSRGHWLVPSVSASLLACAKRHGSGIPGKGKDGRHVVTVRVGGWAEPVCL